MRDKLTHTCNSPPETMHIEMTALMQDWLTDSINLMMQARQAHRDVKDHHFSALHVLFDKIYTDAGKSVALIAGQIAQLGGTAQSSSLDIARGKKHVAEQAGAIAFYVELMRKAVTSSPQLRDAATLTQVSRGAEMSFWFAESHTPSQN